MAMAELRHQMHMQEVEKKIKLLQMNWFIKNYEQATGNLDKSKPIVSIQSTKLIDEIRGMRALIKDINGKLEEYQKRINAKESEKPDERATESVVTHTSYMYPIRFDIEQQLYNGIRYKLYHLSKFIFILGGSFKFLNSIFRIVSTVFKI